MLPPPFDIRKELDGWTLFWAQMELSGADDGRLAALRTKTCERARGRMELAALSSYPAVAALRRLFRAAGCDPTRYRPSSEALLRRILKGDDLPSIHPFVDINNCLSLELAVPCCVMSEGSFTPPLVLRRGEAGESYQSLRGPFRLEGKPLLSDAIGPLDTPITGNERVKVKADTKRAWLVAYLPSEVVSPSAARDALEGLVSAAPVARVLQLAAS
jgi:DNA/RNA-binding domain of Phe-tRNA-synthetase-like protein